MADSEPVKRYMLYGMFRWRFSRTSILVLLVWTIAVYAFLQLSNSRAISEFPPLRASVVQNYLHIEKPEPDQNASQPYKHSNTGTNNSNAVAYNTQTIHDVLEKAADQSNDRTTETNVEPNVKLLRGYHRPQKGFLTIALCTVPRNGVSYLLETLLSLIMHASEEEKDKIVIVVFLGSFDTKWVNGTLADIDREFSEEVRRGLIQVVQPRPDIYPNFSTITKRTFNDSLDRVHWRTKQNIDFAYIFSYCQNISKYYIHVEDDIISAKEYVKEIKTFIDNVDRTKTYWFCIEFSGLGFIGKLFHSGDLHNIKLYLLLFKTEKPCDLLMEDMKRIMTQTKKFQIKKSLFQHRGLVSSLQNKKQLLTDKRFKDNTPSKQQSYESLKAAIARSRSNFINPEASIETSIEHYQTFKPENAYLASTHSFFWGKSPVAGDDFTIKLHKPTKLKEINVTTGNPLKNNDHLKHGILKIGNKVNETDECDNLEDVGAFVNGDLHVNFTVAREARCVVIEVTEKQDDWLVIRDIQLII